MNINQIEVKGITYQVEDAEARSGLAQAVVDIGTIKEELPKKAVFNDEPWTDILSEITDVNNVVQFNWIQAMKRSGFIYMNMRGSWLTGTQSIGINLFSVPEKWKPYMTNNELNIGIGSAWYNDEPYLQFFRLRFIKENVFSVGENTTRSNGQISMSVCYPALHT